MKVEISIKDDTELRNHIKEVIKGEVVSIARGEIRSIIKEVFGEKYGASLPEPEKILREEMSRIINKDINVDRYGNSNYVRDVAKAEAIKIVREVFEKGV